MAAPSSIAFATHLRTDQLVGSYRIVRFLAIGGMSEVYVAHQVNLGRKVVLKLMKPEHARSSELRERFQAEAKLLSTRLDGQRGVVRVTDVGTVAIATASGELEVPYLVQDYLEGATLEEHLGRLSWPARKAIALAVADAMIAIHDAEIVHRDLKPSNIFVLPDGDDRIRVLDFGIAKSLSPSGDRGQTAVGVAIGTPDYMPPEQRRDAHSADARSDIYAFGCVLFAMIHGASPNASGVTRTATDVPAALARLIDEMIADNPNHRPASMTDVRKRLATIDWPDANTPRQVSLAVIVGVIVTGVALIGFAIWLLLHSPSSTRLADARAADAPGDEPQPIDAPTDMPVIDAASSEANPFVAIVPGTGKMEAYAVGARVTLEVPREPFSLQQHEVTWGEWATFVGGRQLAKPADETDDMPVHGVTFALASAYCGACRGRLPTEPEWQWAATGGNRTTYPWGNDWPEHADFVWFGSEARAHPVGRSRFDVVRWAGGELHDLMANVEEWTSSAYSLPGDHAKYRVTRGFPLSSPTDTLYVRREAGARGRSRLCAEGACPKPGGRALNIGFRCARGPDQPATVPPCGGWTSGQR